MANWKYTLNIKKDWELAKDGKLECSELGKRIAKKLKLIFKFDTEFKEEIDNLIYEFENIEYEDIEYFDSVMESLYNFGDTLLDCKCPTTKLLWIGTF